MTPFGKLLVYLNAFVALVLFGWAVSLYTNRTNWFDETPEGGTAVPGQLTLLAKEIAALNGDIRGQQAGYAREAALCRKREDIRDSRQLVQRATLLGLKLGTANATFRTLRMVREDGSAEIVQINNIEVVGDVVNGLDGKPLRSHGALRAEFAKLLEDTAKIQKTLIEQRDAYKRSGDEILVEQIELFRQKDILANLRDEKSLLDDAKIVWEEQLRTLEARKNQLLTRLEAGGNPRPGSN